MFCKQWHWFYLNDVNIFVKFNVFAKIYYTCLCFYINSKGLKNISILNIIRQNFHKINTATVSHTTLLKRVDFSLRPVAIQLDPGADVPADWRAPDDSFRRPFVTIADVRRS